MPEPPRIPAEAAPAPAPQGAASDPSRSIRRLPALRAGRGGVGAPHPLGPKLAVVAGWAGLIAVVLLIAVSAVRYRQDIA